MKCFNYSKAKACSNVFLSLLLDAPLLISIFCAYGRHIWGDLATVIDTALQDVKISKYFCSHR